MTPRYHPGEGQRCSGCGRSQWLIGRTLAECCFCGTALPLADSHQTGARVLAFDGDKAALRAHAYALADAIADAIAGPPDFDERKTAPCPSHSPTA